MPTDGQTFLTEEGLEKIKTELAQLKLRRKEVALRIQEAKELGDLSENAEYSEAKNDQAFNEGRIIDLEQILKTSTVVGKRHAGTKTVGIGSTVVTETNGQSVKYEIVGINEADPSAGRISHESPLGQAFIGKQVGDTIEIAVPKGLVTFVVKDIA